jgi:hypothetical protein
MDVDVLKARIRAQLERRRRAAAQPGQRFELPKPTGAGPQARVGDQATVALPGASGVCPEPVALAARPCAASELVRASLLRAREYADIGCAVPELSRFRGAQRHLGRVVARIVLFFSRFLTNRQREFNKAVLSSLRCLNNRVDKLAGVSAEGLVHRLAALEQEIGQLKGRLAALERLPGSTGHSTAVVFPGRLPRVGPR